MTDLIGLGIQSADGRWEWDGQAWRPMSASGAARPPEPRTPSPPRVRYDPSPRPVIGALSHDGRYYSDGVQWALAVSADGRWRWSGTAWEPTTAALPISSARPFESPEMRRDLAIMALSVACISLLLGTAGDAVSIAIRSGAAGRSLSTSQQQGIATVVVLPAILFLLSYVAAAVAIPMWCH